jgi:hypothetical protein
MGFGVWGLGFGVWGLGFGVSGEAGSVCDAQHRRAALEGARTRRARARRRRQGERATKRCGGTISTTTREQATGEANRSDGGAAGGPPNTTPRTSRRKPNKNNDSNDDDSNVSKVHVINDHSHTGEEAATHHFRIEQRRRQSRRVIDSHLWLKRRYELNELYVSCLLIALYSAST